MKDDAALAPVPAPHAPGAPPVSAGARRTLRLEAEEALRLLASVPLGRIVFTRRALPAVRPVNHLVDRGDIIVRTHDDAALALLARAGGTPGVVVAYETDLIDVEARLGWSVVVTGFCRLVTDPEEAARYRGAIRPWTDRALDQVLRIRPDLVTGIRQVAAE
ncbi:pyridoxamine 5'-phosphate oxidase family protein [Streptomyces showdoensis]|uniref:Pyridoxamine 5'-phosphate oxidase n=1 Tax=Streptomyces showdoensis TaxID=68268 RepID=A0A2P2GW44_STREW|nr:pyridoxamine 5'-phosphate oxidase family protein [Streptomyces showdoensis]KKZ75155.1 pyridoxamine 5'-phosphate oxidase [Streptomyces showdoensis]